MNKLLKNTLLAGGLVGAFFAADAQAQSFNVTIGEIELVSDADNYIATAATIYDPATGVGESAVKTVDFFAESTQSYNLDAPANGVYESMIVHFDTVEAVSTGLTDLDLTTVVPNMFTAYNARFITVFGALGVGGSDIATVTGATTAIPMQPVVVAAGVVKIPEFNWNFPASSVTTDVVNSDVVLVQAPNPYTVARTVDSGTVPDFEVHVDAEAFDGAPGFVSGTSEITVGLFDSTLVSPRPMFQQAFTPAATFLAGTSQTITFYDVPDATFMPIAWLDANSNQLLDQGEIVVTHSATVATSEITVAGVDVDYSSVGVLDDTAVAFGYRTFDLEIPMGDLDGATPALSSSADGTFSAGGVTVVDANAGPLATNTWASTSGTALFQVEYDLYGGATRAFNLAIGYGEGLGNSDVTIDAGETLRVVMANAAADDIAGVEFNTAGELLTVSGIPFTAVSQIAADTVGEFSIRLRSTDNTAPTTRSVHSGTNDPFIIEEAASLTAGGIEVENPVSGVISVSAEGGNDLNGTIDPINLGTL